MRRFWSISAVIAQVAFLLSPAWSQDMSPLCCQKAAVAACHRTAGHSHAAAADTGRSAKAKKAHHCAEMAKAEAPVTGRSLTAGHSHPCPMDCCAQGSPQSVNAVAAVSLVPPLAATDAELHFAPVVFARAGFSSHTDRGPPQA
jgi:hypothetical protein